MDGSSMDSLHCDHEASDLHRLQRDDRFAGIVGYRIGGGGGGGGSSWTLLTTTATGPLQALSIRHPLVGRQSRLFERRDTVSVE